MDQVLTVSRHACQYTTEDQTGLFLSRFKLLPRLSCSHGRGPWLVYWAQINSEVR
jgi:hypothetical protein